jgi:putative transposase
MIGNTTDTMSQSELSKKLNHRLPVTIFQEMYSLLLVNVRSLKPKRIRQIKRATRIIDSSALPATPSMTYAKHRSSKNGFKMHTVVTVEYLPDAILLKNGNSSDKKSLKWAIQPGFVHIFDRGYNDYRQFRWIDEHSAWFVTRALSNITYRILKNRRVGHRQKEKGILSDRVIQVTENRITGETYSMRMVTFRFVDTLGRGREFSLLTNILDKPADVIAELYRERWNIEVVFRWLKSFLKINHWMSRSINGVLIQLYVALCAYLMVLLAKLTNRKKFQIMKDAVYVLAKKLKDILADLPPGSYVEHFVRESS